VEEPGGRVRAFNPQVFMARGSKKRGKWATTCRPISGRRPRDFVSSDQLAACYYFSLTKSVYRQFIAKEIIFKIFKKIQLKCSLNFLKIIFKNI